MSAAPPKPVSEVWKPELVRLPELSRRRLAFRQFTRAFIRVVVKLTLRLSVEGAENLPQSGAYLIVINHLGNADVPALAAALPFAPDGLAKIELRDLPILGKWMDAYGVIWLHRGRADRRALRAALDGLAQGRAIAIAPEGRYSLSGALEEGSPGAAFLALQADVPIAPVAIFGSENKNLYASWARLRRARVNVRIGKPFRLDEAPSAKKEALTVAARRIMEELAALLPPSYRGESFQK
ncbi:MAG: 1-acyl-sn-glycerol-3-phosphate acyltransferase [Anaerolineales bacterium]|nr:1-acyl-sn-glycerol-3-phosphate acyltransferase [Anaerolineales bacterium]